MNNFLIGFRCIRCGKSYMPQDVFYTCPDCNGNLDATYDYHEIGKLIDPETLKSNDEHSVWRYRPFLPLEQAESPIPLKIGMTPLTLAPTLGERLGLRSLYIKNDGLTPSGSFKDRASFIVSAYCIEKNLRKVCAASTGNAGVSLACLAASARLDAIIFAPETAPKAKVAQLLIYGARVFLVRGTYSQAFDLCEGVAKELNWYNRNTGTNPYTREGKKTVSFEIWEQMGFEVPDMVFVSVGDGNIISGVHKGFVDLREAGLTDRVPRLVGVQATGSAAITQAFDGDGVIRPVEAETLADSISVSKPSDGEAALKAVRESGGMMVAVEDDEILKSIKSLAETEGVFAEPSAATSLAGLNRLAGDRSIDPTDRIVLLVTGNGLKDVENALKATGQATTVDPDVNLVLRVLSESE